MHTPSWKVNSTIEPRYALIFNSNVQLTTKNIQVASVVTCTPDIFPRFHTKRGEDSHLHLPYQEEALCREVYLRTDERPAHRHMLEHVSWNSKN